jgi:hypothetical protein
MVLVNSFCVASLHSVKDFADLPEIGDEAGALGAASLVGRRAQDR